MWATRTSYAAQGDTLSIDHSVRTAWKMDTFHYHDGIELFLALTDGVNCFMEDRVYGVHRGDLFVFPPMTIHRTVLSGEAVYERYVLSFRPEYIADFSETCAELLQPLVGHDAGLPTPIRLSEEKLAELLELIRKAEQVRACAVYRRDIRERLALMEILLFINGALTIANPPPVLLSDPNYEKLKPVIEYINGNLARELSLDILSARFYLSRSYLGRLFRKCTGFTVTEYIVSRRIALARGLLRDGRSVTEACEESGFRNYSHFIRTFTALVGISPKQYAISSRRE